MRNDKSDLGIVMLEAICAMNDKQLCEFVERLVANHLILEEEGKRLKALLRG